MIEKGRRATGLDTVDRQSQMHGEEQEEVIVGGGLAVNRRKGTDI